MIIKIKAEELQNSHNSYWLFEASEQILHSLISCHSKEEWEAIHHLDKILLTKSPHSWDYSKGAMLVGVIRFFSKSGEFKSIAFNTLAFIMNDDGKTIERIYPRS